jgi:hypothetical protein
LTGDDRAYANGIYRSVNTYDLNAAAGWHNGGGTNQNAKNVAMKNFSPPHIDSVHYNNSTGLSNFTEQGLLLIPQ